MPMNIIQHKPFKKVINSANSSLRVQDRDTFWQLLERKTVDTKGRLVEELHRHWPNGSLTADSWTSDDGRELQAVTYHYLTPEFEMDKVLVGMDEIKEPQQTAEVLLQCLSKYNILCVMIICSFVHNCWFLKTFCHPFLYFFFSFSWRHLLERMEPSGQRGFDYYRPRL